MKSVGRRVGFKLFEGANNKFSIPLQEILNLYLKFYLSFHVERKFFQVMRTKQGGVRVSESTTKTELAVELSNEETF
ncbi:hypothetical protein Scep_003591 [Stephania cephalantha]|uniref:Uncharacterized protein n=1 Tax=Stephania cephalantha TaxID=152367 RepID=A0AAP0KQT1_9MAGN